jgi:hypothetical protein
MAAVKAGFEDAEGSDIARNGMRHKRHTLENGTQMLIKDEYYRKSNYTELMLGRYPFEQFGRKDKDN